MPGGGNLIKDGVRRPTAKKNRSKYHFTRSLVIEFPFGNSSQRPTRCVSAPKIMDSSHSRSASPRERPLHRPPSPPDSPTAFDNQGYQHDDDPNHNESFTSSASPTTNGTNGHMKNEKTLEAVNLELINMSPKKKEVDLDSGTNPYDEYFVPVNEHRKYMRGEKLYVTADKRGEKGGCKRSLCWTLLGLVVLAIIVLIVLAATGLLFSNSPTTLEQYNSSISSARALGGLGGGSQRHGEFTKTDQQHHDSDHETPVKPVIDYSQNQGRNYNQGNMKKQDVVTEADFPQPDFGETAPIYVAQTVEGELKIDNEEYAEVLQDPDADGYKEFTSDFTAALKSALFNRNTLTNDSVRINVQVIQIRRGSVIITYRVHWHAKSDKYDMDDFLTPTKLKYLLNNYLERNNRMISVYHISEDKITTRSVLDKCQINKNDCESGCKFDETTLDFVCTCPPSFILDMDNQKKCVRLLENPQDTQKQYTVLAINNKSHAPFLNNESDIDSKHTTEIGMMETTEAEVDLFLSHIMSDNKDQLNPPGTVHSTSNAVYREPESTQEPTQESLKEFSVEPKLTQEPVPEPTQEPTPEPTQEPTAEPAKESAPEPAQEPVPEPTQEPTPEPVQEPVAEPTQEPTPEPVQEPSSEPAQEPVPEPTQESIQEPTQEPTPEPVQEPSPEPTQEPAPEAAQEPVPEPTQEPTPEPVSEPTQEPTSELTQEPNIEPIKKSSTEPTQEPSPEPSQEPYTESTQESFTEATQEPSPEPTQEPTKKELSSEPTQEPSQEPKKESTKEPVQETTTESTQQPLQETTSKSVQETSPEPINGENKDTTEQELSSQYPKVFTTTIRTIPVPTVQQNTTESEEEYTELESSTMFVKKPQKEPIKESTYRPATEPLLEITGLKKGTPEPPENTNNTSSNKIFSMTDNTTQISITELTTEQHELETLKPTNELYSKPVMTSTNLQETALHATTSEKPIQTENKTTDTTVDLVPISKEDMSDFKTKQPKLLKTLESTTIKQINNSEAENDSMEKQITTPDSLLELDREIKKLLNLPPPENEVHSEIDYSTDAKSDNDEKINTMSLDEISKMLTTNPPRIASEPVSTEQAAFDTTFENKTFREWQHNSYERNFDANNTRSVEGELNDQSINQTQHWVVDPDASSTEATITELSYKIDSFVTTTSTYENYETATNMTDNYNMTPLPMMNQDLLTMNIESSAEPNEEPAIQIQEPYKPDIANLSSISITLDDHLESTPKSIDVSYEPKNEIEDGGESSKLLEFDFVNNREKLRKQSKLDETEQMESTTSSDADWLTERVKEVKFEDVISGNDHLNNTNVGDVKIDDNHNDLEHHQQSRQSNSQSSLRQNDEMMDGFIDYNGEETPIKRDNMNSMRIYDVPMKVNNSKIDNSIKSTTVIDYIYKTTEKPINMGWPNTLMKADDEPAPVWELKPETNFSIYPVDGMERRKLHYRNPVDPPTKEGVKLEEISSRNVTKYEFGNITSLNASNVTGLNVTIYEISNQNLPTTKSSVAQAIEYEDHESEMNPFLPEVENNKSLVKKLQEGHDIEPINVNETQNENFEDGHALSIHNSHNTRGDVPKLISKEDSRVLNNTITQNEANTSTLISHTDNERRDEVIPIFLKDTDDLNVKPSTRGLPTIFEYTDKLEQSTPSFDLLDIVTEDNELNVVPLVTKGEKKVRDRESKFLNSRSVISLIKRADSSNSELTNLA